jgi:hypothetical protein
MKRKKEVAKGAIDTMVQIIDWTPLNKILSKACKGDVEIKMGTGYIPDVTAIFDEDEDYGWVMSKAQKKTESLIIDSECCGRNSVSKNVYISDLKDEPFNVSLFREVGIFKVAEETETGRSIPMFPAFHMDIDIDDIKKCLTSESMPLYEFMGSRYGYNHRVLANELEILQLVYHESIEAEDFSWKEKEDKEWEVA